MMNTSTSTSLPNTAPMPPTSDPLTLFMEDIEKSQTLVDKYVKIQAYIKSLKEEKSGIKDLELPISKQFLDHAIKTLEVENDTVLANMKAILNQLFGTDVKLWPEEMTSLFENLSLSPAKTVRQPQIFMQTEQGLGQQGSLQTRMQQVLLQQGLGQQGSLPPQLGQQILGPRGSFLGQQSGLQRQRQSQLIQQLQQHQRMQMQ